MAMNVERDNKELRVGDEIGLEFGRTGKILKKVVIKSIKWSRRLEYCIVNDEYVYSYGGKHTLVV